MTKLLFLSCFLSAVVAAEDVARWDLGTGMLALDAQGHARMEVAGESWPVAASPLFSLQTENDSFEPETISVVNDCIRATFSNGSAIECAVKCAPGYALFEVSRLENPVGIVSICWCSLAVPEGAERLDMLNGVRTDAHTVAVSIAAPNVHPCTRVNGPSHSDRAGCTHRFTKTDDAKSAAAAAKFVASCDAQPSGWSVTDARWQAAKDLSGCVAVRAWVCGDGQGEQLKIQLTDTQGGCRDTYIPITFTGWRQVRIEPAPYDTLRYDRVAGVNIYYNGLPASREVTCLVDGIEAMVVRDGVESAVPLEDFEAESPFWRAPTNELRVETLARYGLEPARFGVLCSENAAFADTMDRFEAAAGLHNPHPGGVWSKVSPRIKRSYLFITTFSEAQYDDVAAMAKRGGFDTVIIDQGSWTRGTGHYDINTDAFPGGLDALTHTIKRFHDDGFHAGLHFLSASIYPPDAYITPVPDPRLVKDGAASLAVPLDEASDTVTLEDVSGVFPDTDGGYMGHGTAIQIDNEIIHYQTIVSNALTGCQRGALGTAAAAHDAGAPVAHLMRAYGYHLYNMDSTLLDEVAANFARVANACDIDMVYFDGSEWLQGDHWYYNARMHKAFYDKIVRKDLLFQASSASPYSWHIVSRSASADGHGDLKGYLDERSGGFEYMHRNFMPLDIGWYYGYDPTVTPDVFEYILGVSLAYDSSMSFQVSLDTAKQHPFVGDILDLIARYERLRLSGRVPAAMRERMRIPETLAGVKTPEEREKLQPLRREYHLVGDEGHEVFQRVDYSSWRETAPDATWTLDVAAGPARVGVELRAVDGPCTCAGPSYDAPNAVMLEAFTDLAQYRAQPGGGVVRAIMQGDGGSTLDGVTQRAEVLEGDAPAGIGGYVRYTAESKRPEPGGWSYLGKTFNPPLDLSWHKALAFWMRGDGKGGAFKLQFTDGRKAADFYVANDFTGWRYIQLERPVPDPMDYAQVRTLGIYYNGLPANIAVACDVAGVKALPAKDERMLDKPWVEVDGHRMTFPGKLANGETAILYPDDAWRHYAPGKSDPEIVPAEAAPEVAAGGHTLRFGQAAAYAENASVRTIVYLPERYPVE